jgi:RES domain
MTTLPSVIYRVCWGDDPLALTEMAYIRRSPGRFDDPDLRYRVHYSASSMAGAFIEVLASLRPNREAMKQYAAIAGDDDLLSAERAIREALELRSASVLLVPHNDEVVDVGSSRSRTTLETLLSVRQLKDGGFRGSSYELSRRASRVIYDGNHIGLAIASSETGVESSFDCYCIFEEFPGAGTVRAQLVRRSTRGALDEQIALREAIMYLGLSD